MADIWEKLYKSAAALYKPSELSPFIYARHVVCAIESGGGAIFTGFCVESCCGVLDICAERAAALNMLLNSGEKVIKRLIVCRGTPPSLDSDDIPCGACREFLMQLDASNRDTEILIDYALRRVVRLEALIPCWWGWPRVER